MIAANPFVTGELFALHRRTSSVEQARMSEPDGLSRAVIAEPLMLSRLAQYEQMREFLVQMWLQNPVLAGHGGNKAKDLVVSPIATSELSHIWSMDGS
jgi:hypothetical protein